MFDAHIEFQDFFCSKQVIIITNMESEMAGFASWDVTR